MPVSKVIRTIILAAPLFLLTACDGEGWEPVRYEGAPYTHEGTAGFGVAYVRANMMPRHGMNTETSMPETSEMMESAAPEETPPPPEPEASAAPEEVEIAPAIMEEPEPVIAPADPLFDNNLRK